MRAGPNAAQASTKLYADTIEQHPIGKSLTDLAMECSTELDTGLEAMEVSTADGANFSSLDELRGSANCFFDSPAIFAVQFGLSLVVARSLLLAFFDCRATSEARLCGKRNCVDTCGCELLEGRAC